MKILLMMWMGFCHVYVFIHLTELGNMQASVYATLHLRLKGGEIN